MARDYYSTHLSADRLRRVYDLAPPRVRQYLEAEVEHVLRAVRPEDLVLELGCGFGRVLRPLAGRAGEVVGIDTSAESVALARDLLADCPNVTVERMDAADLRFPDASFDLVACVQNGISAFHADQRRLLAEAVRVLRPGRTAYFSTYAAGFWDHRLEWFRLQSGAGLLGPIDWQRTGGGRIACTDGFEASALSGQELSDLARGLDADARVVEVDGSSLFLELTRNAKA